MKLTEKLNKVLEANIVRVIKPTKENLKALKKEGIHGDEPKWYFDLYNVLIDGENYTMKDRDFTLGDFQYLENKGLKY